MKIWHEVLLQGDFDVDADVTPTYPPDGSSKSDGFDVENVRVKYNGVDITKWLSDDELEEFADAYEQKVKDGYFLEV